MSEEPVLFGAEGDVVGILTRPAAAQPDHPTIVLLNAGVIHRVGPHRLHVTLARRLAANGFAAFRIDLSGIGDSPLRAALPFREQAVVDTRAAMDKVGELTGCRRFILFGLCSGADNAIAAALADERVAAVVLLDGFTYVTRRAQLRKLVGRVRELGTTRRVVSWGLRLALQRVRARIAPARTDVEGAPEQSGREPPPVEVFGGQLETLLARGVRILACYSGSLEERYNHEDQLFELLPALRGRVDRRYFPAANHQFTEIAARERLMVTVADWVMTHFR
jgi:dienelactone hydrolase